MFKLIYFTIFKFRPISRDGPPVQHSRNVITRSKQMKSNLSFQHPAARVVEKQVTISYLASFRIPCDTNSSDSEENVKSKATIYEYSIIRHLICEQLSQCGVYGIKVAIYRNIHEVKNTIHLTEIYTWTNGKHIL